MNNIRCLSTLKVVDNLRNIYSLQFPEQTSSRHLQLITSDGFLQMTLDVC